MTARQKYLIVCLSLAFAVLSFSSSLRSSATYDEPLSVLAGVAAWRTGQYDVDFSNPPLSHYWQSIPFLALKLGPLPPSKLLSEQRYRMSYLFLYNDRYPLDRLLHLARFMSVILAVFLGLVMAAWCSLTLGPREALAAMVAFAFCPVLLGHGALVKADMAGALGVLLTLWAVWSWTQQLASRRCAVISGLAAGVALCSKYSAALILFVVAWNWLSAFLRMRPKLLMMRLLQLVLIFGSAVGLVMAISLSRHRVFPSG